MPAPSCIPILISREIVKVSIDPNPNIWLGYDVAFSLGPRVSEQLPQVVGPASGVALQTRKKSFRSSGICRAAK